MFLEQLTLNEIDLFQGVFVFYVVQYQPVRYDDEKFPTWAEYLGLLISFSSMMWVPIYAIYYLVTQPGTFMEVSKNNFEFFNRHTSHTKSSAAGLFCFSKLLCAKIIKPSFNNCLVTNS